MILKIIWKKKKKEIYIDIYINLQKWENVLAVVNETFSASSQMHICHVCT